MLKCINVYDYTHCSGSVAGLTSVEVAKQLFDAFATRTQAYRLHHAFGLTLFNHTVMRKLALTKNAEEFEVSVQFKKTVN